MLSPRRTFPITVRRQLGNMNEIGQSRGARCARMSRMQRCEGSKLV